MSTLTISHGRTFEGIIRVLFREDPEALARFGHADRIGERWLAKRIGFARPRLANQGRDWGPRLDELRAIKAEIRERLFS